MEKEDIKSGDFLKDVEIVITIHSGHSELSDLEKLMHALTASATSLVDTRLEMIELERKFKVTSNGKLRTVVSKFFIE